MVAGTNVHCDRICGQSKVWRGRNVLRFPEVWRVQPIECEHAQRVDHEVIHDSRCPVSVLDAITETAEGDLCDGRGPKPRWSRAVTIDRDEHNILPLSESSLGKAAPLIVRYSGPDSQTLLSCSIGLLAAMLVRVAPIDNQLREEPVFGQRYFSWKDSGIDPCLCPSSLDAEAVNRLQRLRMDEWPIASVSESKLCSLASDLRKADQGIIDALVSAPVAGLADTNNQPAAERTWDNVLVGV